MSIRRSGRPGPVTPLSELLARFEASPFLRIEHDGARAALHFGNREPAAGLADVRTGMLSVSIDREAVRPLLERHPQLQATAGAVRLRATGAGVAVADALIRWRIDLECFAPQLRDASP